MNRLGSPLFHRNPFAVAVLMLSTLPLSAAAQDSAAPQAAAAADESRLSEVKVHGREDEQDFNSGVSTVGAKTPTAVRDLPQTVTVINRSVLDSQGATSLVDALRNVPGITLSAGEGSQIGNNINLRGFSARTDIYLDGFRDRGQYQRDIFALDAVEVLEGSASLLFGRGSTGGIINQVSKRPQLKPVGEVGLSLGSDNFYRSTADIGDALSKDSAYRVEVMGQYVEATRNSVIRKKDYGVAPSISFGIGTPTQITLSLLSQHNNDLPDYGFPVVQLGGQSQARPLNVPWHNYYGFSNNSYGQDVNVFAADLSHKFGNGLTLRSNTQYSQYHTDPAATPLSSLRFQAANGNWCTYGMAAGNAAGCPVQATPAAGTPLSQLNISAQLLDRSIRDSSLFNQTDLLFELHTGPLLHHLVAGTEIGRDEYTNNYASWFNFNYNNGTGLAASQVAIFNLASGNDSSIPSGANVYRVPNNRTQTNANTLAGYFNDQIDIGTHWKLIAGLRWDQFSANQNVLTYCYTPNTTTCVNTPAGSAGLILNNADPTQTAAVQAHNAQVLQSPVLTYYGASHTDYQFSPRAGLIWQPDLVQSYYFAWGTSFDPLAETVNNLPTSGTAAGQYAAGGGDAPEKNESYEIGAKWDLLKGNLSLDSALFQVEKTNARIQDPATLDYVLAGKERVRGGELKVTGRILPGWQVIGGYTFLSGKLLSSPQGGNSGFALPNAPKNTATLWSTYDFLRHWEVGGGFTYSSNIPVTNITGSSVITTPQVVPGYTRADLTAAYLARKWNLRLNVMNLTDRDYFAAASGARVTPADGRREVLTFTYYFR